MPKPVIVPATAERTIHKLIMSINYNIGHSIEVRVAESELLNGEYIVDQNSNVELITIRGEAYNELISVRPQWHPTKDSEFFDERDIWHILDAIEIGSLTSDDPDIITEEITIP